jgi:hypothetical protein
MRVAQIGLQGRQEALGPGRLRGDAIGLQAQGKQRQDREKGERHDADREDDFDEAEPTAGSAHKFSLRKICTAPVEPCSRITNGSLPFKGAGRSTGTLMNRAAEVVNTRATPVRSN